jgi:hypothetical protein
MVSKESADELINSLREAIEKDRRYFIEAKTDPIFLPVRDRVNTLLNQLAQEAKRRAEKRYEECLSLTSEIDFNWNSKSLHKKECQKGLYSIKLLARSGYSDYLDLESLSNDVLKSARDFLDETLLQYKQNLNKLKTEIDDIEKTINKMKKEIKHHGWLGFGCGFGIAILSLILVIIIGAALGAKYLSDEVQFTLLFILPICCGIIVGLIIYYLKEHSNNKNILPIIIKDENHKLQLEEYKKFTINIIDKINYAYETVRRIKIL